MIFNTHLGLNFKLSPSLHLLLFGSYSYNSLENASYFPSRYGHKDRLSPVNTKVKMAQ